MVVTVSAGQSGAEEGEVPAVRQSWLGRGVAQAMPVAAENGRRVRRLYSLVRASALEPSRAGVQCIPQPIP